MKTKKNKWLIALGLSLILGTTAIASFASCVECNIGPPNFQHCYGDICDNGYVEGSYCCGNVN
jgi:hypothetical protein